MEGYELALEDEDIERGQAECEQFEKDLLKNVGFSLVRVLKRGVNAEPLADRSDQDGS